METARRIKQIFGQVARYGVATGACESDVSSALRGALAPKRPQHFSALTRPEDILLPAVDRERSPQGTENSRARIRRVPNRARDLDSPPVRVAHSGREGIYTNSLLTKM